MKLLVCSDLHFEFHKDNGKSFIRSMPKDVDAIVVAGDLHTVDGLVDSLGDLSRAFKRVIFVSGNHDFYGGSPATIATIKKSIHFPNLYWLENETLELDGVKFAGCTLWFENGPENNIYSKYVSDFSVIGNFVPWVYQRNAESARFLRDNTDKNTIVITHHIPGYNCVNKEYAGSKLNAFFVCREAEQIIIKNKPRLWIYGHTHTPNDQIIGETRVVANPLGYPRESHGYNEKLVLEV